MMLVSAFLVIFAWDSAARAKEESAELRSELRRARAEQADRSGTRCVVMIMMIMMMMMMMMMMLSGAWCAWTAPGRRSSSPVVTSVSARIASIGSDFHGDRFDMDLCVSGLYRLTTNALFVGFKLLQFKKHLFHSIANFVTTHCDINIEIAIFKF